MGPWSAPRGSRPISAEASASKRVDAVTKFQTLQTSKTSNKPTRGRVYPPPTPSQTVRLARLEAVLATPPPPCPLKMCRKNEYILLMGAFGSDTRRYDMHSKCLSMSICHSWGTFFTFRPLSSIFFMKIASKVTPSWPQSCLKSLKSIG